MKTTKCLYIATLFAIFIVSCGNNNSPDNNETVTNTDNGENGQVVKPKKGTLVYYIDEEECGGLYYNDKLGDDFESALNKLIESREELASLGDKLYVKQMEITSVKPEDGSKVILLHFFEKDEDNTTYPLKMLYTAHDAIDTNGNHYDVQFCDGPINTENRKPEGSYSYQENSNHYLVFAKNYGKDFKSAYENIKPEIDDRIAYLAEHYEQMVTCNSSDIIVTFRKITVINCELKDVEFAMIELDMFSNIYNDYKYFEDFGVLDSNGNFYYDRALPVYDSK